ncbi:hypothetical protein GE061_014444 [Apolygus lucorum]|uniref:Uncharacterized protein n=1 Tax=Apolygus lucorum TaxID=248454 RepID=A0A8S9XQW6_APOLU|nr:hypothetical protein GE061_014444 [Apolygus lucorum]
MTDKTQSPNHRPQLQHCPHPTLLVLQGLQAHFQLSQHQRLLLLLVDVSTSLDTSPTSSLPDPVKEPNQSNPTQYSQDKSGQSSQDETAQSSQDKSAQSSQDRSAQSSQDKSAQSSQHRSAQSSQDKLAQPSLVRRGRKRRAQPETDVHTPSKQLRVSSELEPADVDLPDESDDEFETLHVEVNEQGKYQLDLRTTR